MNGHAPTERLFIGGDTSPGALHDLGDRLALFGRILAIEHPAPKPADRPFVFVEFAPVDPQAVHKCIAALNGTAWRGRTLRIERARPAYLDRLRLEWEEEASNSDPTPPLPSVTFPLRLPRLRKRHKVVVVEQQGTGTKKTSFALSVPPLPFDQAWLKGTGAGLPRPAGQHRGVRIPPVGARPPPGQPRRGQPRVIVEHAETREAMQDAIRHALARAGAGGRPALRVQPVTASRPVADTAAGALRNTAMHPTEVEAPRVADFMEVGDEDGSLPVGAADLDRFNSSDDEEGSGKGRVEGDVPQVDGADDSEGGSDDEQPTDDEQPSGGVGLTAVASSSSGSGGGVEAAGEAAGEAAMGTEDSGEGVLNEEQCDPWEAGGGAEEEEEGEGPEEGGQEEGPALWGLRAGCAFHREEELGAIRTRWQEARGALGTEWRSLKRAAGKTKGKTRGGKRPMQG